MSSLELFVEKNLGNAVLLNLRNIHRGGVNNQKGRDYEDFFQLFKAFELASYDIDHSKHLLSCQELAFIDDICYWDLENSVKHNFQAKNSSGSTADWDSEITIRCERQTIIDTQFYKVQESRNYLLVSCELKKENNLQKIPVSLHPLNTCIFFPYFKSLVELLDQTKLSSYIATLIDSNDNSQIDFAAKLILGVLKGGTSQDIKSIFEQACSNAHPNPFIKFRKENTLNHEIPDWIKQIVTTSSNKTTYRLQSSRIYLSLETGFEMSASLDLIQKVPVSKIQEIINIKDLVMLFMNLTSLELDISTSLDSSPLRGV